MRQYLLSAFADEYASDFDTQLSMLSDNNIQYIEPRFINGKNVSLLSSEEAHIVKTKLDDHGIRVSSIGSPLGKISLSDDFTAYLETAKRVFETANILDTSFVRIFSFYPHPETSIADSREEVLEKMNALVGLADKHQLTLCHENEAGIYGESPEACLDLLKAFNGKLGCVFDMGNFVLGGYKPFPDAYTLLQPDISYFHIKDALYEGAIVPPGCGNACIEEILKMHSNYSDKNVFVSLEPHLETFNGLNKIASCSFENPYKFNSKEEAFLTAIKCLKNML